MNERLLRSYLSLCAFMAVLCLLFPKFGFALTVNSDHTARTIMADSGIHPDLILIAGLCFILSISALLAFAVRRITVLRRMLAEKTGESAARNATLRSVMDNSSTGMAFISPLGEWLKVNKSFCELLGYKESELLCEELSAVSHPDDMQRNLELNREILSGNIKSYRMEKRFLHKKSGTIWTIFNVTSATNASGNPEYFIAQIQDISARREMDRLKNEFISTVSHELRTPLTSIRGALGLIAGGVLGKIPEKAADFIRIAHKNSERLILIINDILDIEKVEAGKMAMHPKPVDVDQILQQALEANQMYGDKYKIKYLLKQAPQDTQVLADPDRLMQVLANLLSNAAKFSPPNSEVWVGAEIKGDQVVFSIRDFGNGIPEEFRPRMFEKFGRADNSDARKTEGTGLGLRITAKLIETMKGKIDFETETGKGTCFYFTLPKAHTNIIVSIEPVENTSSYPILICEDDKTMSGLIKAYLERAGFRTEAAYTLSEAREKLQSKTFAAVTMDIMLPDGSGVEFIEELRTRPETHDLPVVIVSGKASESKQTMQGNRIGVVDWLDKPSETARLDSRLIHSLKRAVSGDIERLPHVLHIEDDNDLSHILNRAMMDHAIVVNAPTLRSAEKWLEHTYFDLIILDVELPDGSGLDFLASLKEMTDNQVPVIILSASEVDVEIQKQVSASLVKSRVSETYIIDRILAVIDHSSAHRKKKGALS